MIKKSTGSRSLPANPSLENLKKQARTLQKQVRRRSTEALERVRVHHGEFAGDALPLSAAQFVLAREYGFDSWPKLRAYVSAARAASSDEMFDTAAGVERLYAKLSELARSSEWLPKAELVELRQANDLPRLIVVAERECGAASMHAELESTDPRATVERLCLALDARLRGERPLPLGGGGRSADPPDMEACVVVVHSTFHTHLTGQRHALIQPSTKLGRNTSNEVVLHCLSVSREHAVIERVGGDFWLRDLESSNGTFVNDEDERISSRRLADGDEFALGDPILRFMRGGDLDAKYRALIDTLSIQDALTCTRTRACWVSETNRQIYYSRGNDAPLSALMVCIDDLAALADRFGGLCRNGTLRRVGHVLRQKLGREAIIGRYANDRFAITLPGADLARALALAEELRADLAAREIRLLSETLRITVSIGAATLYRTTGADKLVDDASAAQELAREGGGNSVRGPREEAA
ncbi:MAG TPA: FHA domain-containing protein [Polyangiaceae bacterium]